MRAVRRSALLTSDRWLGWHRSRSGWAAEYSGEILSGGEALSRAGIAPLVLGGKDGLALISANGVSVGHAALVVARAAGVAEAADIAVALSMEATGANPSILQPAVGLAKPIPGQVAAADHLRTIERYKVILRDRSPLTERDEYISRLRVACLA